MKTCTLELHDQVNCRFNGLDPKTRRECQDKLSFMVPYARHVPAFKMGRWDGKMKFFDVGGRTYINLIELVLPTIIEAGYEVDIVDHRIAPPTALPAIDESYFIDRIWPTGHPLEGQEIVLRSFQVQLINALLQNPQGLFIGPTGIGKTLATAAMARSVEEFGGPGSRTMTIVPSKTLVKQTAADFVNLGLNTGMYYGDVKEVGRTHTISTWQSLTCLERRSKDDQTFFDLISNLDAVIIDECHTTSAESKLHGILTNHMGHIPIRWGITGTVPKEEWNKASLLSAIGPIVGEIETKTLQDNDVLANLHVHVKQLKDSGTYADFQREQDHLLRHEPRIEWLANYIVNNVVVSGNTIVMVSRIETGEALEEMIGSRYDGEVMFIHGSLTTKTRDDMLRRTKNGENVVLIGTFGLLSTGVDIPFIYNVVLLEPGKSFIRVIQSIGRGIRRAEGKDFVNIHDIASVLKFSKRHLTKRMEFYREKQYPYELESVVYENPVTKPRGRHR